MPLAPIAGRVGRLVAGGLLVVALAACAARSPTAPSPTNPPATDDPAPVDPLAGFTLDGSPEAPTGARWSYEAVVVGTRFDLEGILFKPAGPGPFPAVVLSHELGTNVDATVRVLAEEMARWGLVAIATNYTHAGGVPVGAPGTEADEGASAPNVQRARQLVELLRGLGYVDMARVALHGHSMGAFVTTATAAAHPDLFRAASHTAGGIEPGDELSVAGVRAPYQLHHGALDDVVPVADDELLAGVLEANGVTHELHIYPDFGHHEVALDGTVLDRIRQWYLAHGVL